MKAIVQTRFGSADVLELADVETPAVDENAVLVRVVAASLNPLDWHYMTGRPYFMRLAGAGIRSPRRRIPGVDVAGTVESVGKSVTRLQPGDEVFGRAAGSLAEFVAAPEDTIVSKPADITFEQAAATRLAALTALQALRDKGRIGPGQKVLINGASGGVGTCAVQIAKSFGAEVTGVCSTGNVDMVRSIGADHVVDYTQDDYTRGEARYDLLFDNMGNHPPSANKSVIKPKGIYVLVGGPKKNRLLGPVPYLVRSVFAFMFASQTAALFNTKDNEDDLRVLRGLLESGSLVPIIDRSYRLGEAAAAFRHLETGHARGKIIITV